MATRGLTFRRNYCHANAAIQEGGSSVKAGRHRATASQHAQIRRLHLKGARATRSVGDDDRGTHHCLIELWMPRPVVDSKSGNPAATSNRTAPNDHTSIAAFKHGLTWSPHIQSSEALYAAVVYTACRGVPVCSPVDVLKNSEVPKSAMNISFVALRNKMLPGLKSVCMTPLR